VNNQFIGLTGSTGFIGKNLMSYCNKSFVPIDFRKSSFCIDDFTDMSTIIHSAAIVHKSKKIPGFDYYQVNYKKTIELAKTAKLAGVSHFIFLSSIYVYGTNGSSVNQFLNEKSPCKPKTPYGKSKLMAEQELLVLQSPGFKISIIRSPLVYGRNCPGNISLLYEFIKRIPVLPFKNKNTRSIIYVGNLCEAINKIIEKQVEGVFLPQDTVAPTLELLVRQLSLNLNKKIILYKMPEIFVTIGRFLNKRIFDCLYGSLEFDSSITNKLIGDYNKYSFEDAIKKSFRT